MRRAFAGIDLADLDPFVHMDQMGEVDYGPGEPKGTPWHPHRGFETVTYMIDGTFLHQDSIGGGGVIQNGATQWMTAGAGILHIERPPDALIDSGGLFHGIQLWVNLPARLKMTHPRYQDIEAQARRAADQRERRRDHPRDRRRPGRHRRTRRDPHANLARARLAAARARACPAVGPRVQRADLRARRQGTVGEERAPRRGPDGRARRRRLPGAARRRDPGLAHARLRGARSWAASRSASRSRPTGPS